MRLGALILAVALALAAARATGAQPAKGDGPTALAAGFGSVWVGTGRGELLQLDPRSGRARTRVRKEPGQTGHVAAVLVAHGAVWLSDSGLGIARIDPRRSRPLTTVFPAHGPLAADRRSVWAADYGGNRVLRVDPRRARVVAAVRVPGRLVGLAAGRAGAYVAYAPTTGPLTGPQGIRLLQRLDSKSARLVGKPVSFDCDLSVVVGRAALWTVDFCTWRLARRDPRSLEAEVEQGSPRTATFATLAHGSLWVSGGSRIVRFDPATLRMRARLWVRGTVLAGGEGAVWIVDGRLLKKLDPRTNRIVQAFRVPR